VERHWSQEELAHRSGLHRTYISSLERGERNVSLHAIQRLADAFGISVQSLMEV
jgi:transcriptional regulator with XRE-family HTH domain